MGALAHEALLEPQEFNNHAVTDKGATTKAFALELAEAEAKGRRLVQAKERETAMDIAESVRQHPNIGSRFPADGHDLNELSMTWESDRGIKCRGRLDALRWLDGLMWIGDVKTAASADPDEFGKSAVNFNYLLQAAFYHDGVRACSESLEDLLGLKRGAVAAAPLTFEFVVVEKVSPFSVARYLLTEPQLDMGRRMYNRALDLVEAAKSIDYWPGYDYAARPLELPYWAERSMTRLTEGA
jgi:hypothetical protein